MMIWTKRFIAIALVLAVWSVCSKAGVVNDYLLPAPWKVVAIALKMLREGTLSTHLRTSLLRVFFGFGIAFGLAFPLAMLIGFNRICLELLETPLEFIRHIPPLATTPLLILWLGIGEASKLAVIVLASFFPVFLNTVSGLTHCDKKLVEVGEVLGLDRFERIVYIILPSALPVIIVGIRLGFGYAWRALIGAELLAATAGLGYMIIEAEELARPDIVLVGILAIGSMGHLLDVLFLRLSRHLVPWKGIEATLDRS